jgi:fido (protein-threonine AMPylation protein)
MKPTVPQNLPIKVDSSLFDAEFFKAYCLFDEINNLLSVFPISLFSLIELEEAYDSIYPIRNDKPFLDLLLENFKEIKFNNQKKALRVIREKYPKKVLKNRDLKLLHKIILSGLGFDKKEVGFFRTKQNWIGPEGKGMKEAYFFPPEIKVYKKHLLLLEKFKLKKSEEPLVDLAIYFAQALIIHPFMDGNGRVTRLIIPKFLHDKKVFVLPFFFMSRYFKAHRLCYFEKLYLITDKKDWEGWIRFFLKGVLIQAKDQLKIMNELLKIYQACLEAVGTSPSAKKFICQFFQNIILDVTNIKKERLFFEILRQKKLVIFVKGSKKWAILKGVARIMKKRN